MSEETDNIKHDIESTRESMTAKMEAIESKIMGTVDDVKTSVNTTVEQVKQTFDIRQQVHERPWTMFGASLVAGLVLGSLGGSDDDDYKGYSRKEYRYSPSSDAQQGARNYGNQGGEYRYYSSSPSSSQSSYSNQGNEYRYSPSGAQSNYGGQSSYGSQQNYNNQSSFGGQASGLMASISNQFGDELNVIKSAAITTVGNMLRDMIQQNLPQFGEQYERYRRQYGMADSNSTGSGATSGSTSLGGSSMSGSYGSGSSYAGTTGGSSQSESGPMSSGSQSSRGVYDTQSGATGSSYTSGSERSVGIDKTNDAGTNGL
jgi:ElaB/YqjD/DUF883 family membrane-anchored ribosome-binding protein